MADGERVKQLWAPWRMPYVEQSEHEPGCLFCVKAAENRDEENHILYRGPKCFVMMNLYPYNSGHLMVIPYQHVGEFDRLDPNVGAELFETSQVSVHILGELLKPDGFNLGVNQGETAGAGIADHIHLHIVPRWNGDTNFMPVLAGTKVIPELLSSTAGKLRPYFERYTRIK
jgi:ATP adenylyltransferase